MQKILYKSPLIICFTALCLCALPAFSEELVRQRLGFSPGFRDYEIELIRLALRATASSPSDFQLNSIYHESSLERMLAEINKGENIQVTMSTVAANKSLHPTVASFELPEARNLLGFRQFIVRKADQGLFESVQTSAELLKLKPGQAREWSDIAIYKEAGFQLILSFNYGQLFPMLGSKRFDFLPLGVLEMEEAFKFEKERYPELTPINGIYVYYPLKLFVYYHNGDGSRAKTIGKGLKMIFANGVEEAFFNAQFGDKFKTVDRAKAKIFMLDNPAYSKAENKHISEQFISHYHFDKNAVWLSRERAQ